MQTVPPSAKKTVERSYEGTVNPIQPGTVNPIQPVPQLEYSIIPLSSCLYGKTQSMGFEITQHLTVRYRYRITGRT